MIRRLAGRLPAGVSGLWLAVTLSRLSAQTEGGTVPDGSGGLPGVPSVPGYPPISSTPGEPGDPSSPSTPSVPGYPPIPSTPSVPGYPPIPSTPEHPGTPDGVPGYTDAASAFGTVPGVPDPPGEPDLPGNSGEPDKSDEPVVESDTVSPFDNMLGFPLGSAFGSDLLGGFSMSATLTGTYDSNVTRIAQGQDDYFFSLGGNLSYLSKGSPLTFGANYRGRYDQYINMSDFSGYSQGGGLVANYKSGRITATWTAGYDSNHGSPQNYYSNSTFGGNPRDNYSQNYNQGDFNRVNMGTSAVVNYEGRRFSASLSAGIDLDQGSNNYSSSATSTDIKSTSMHAGLTARYRLTKDISLTGYANGNSTTSSGGTYGDTSSFTLGAAALWRYSVLTEFGPGIRYTSSTGSAITGGSGLGRTSIGPTLTVNYKLGRKVTLTSQVGMDFSKYDSGQSADPTISASLALNYQASRLWGMSLSYSQDTQADPTSPGAFYESKSLRLGYHRKVRRAVLNLGVSYLTSTSSTVQGGPVGRPDSNSLSLDSTLSMPVFANTCDASVFVRYNDQSGVYTGSNYGSTGGSWDSFQMGFSISRKF